MVDKTRLGGAGAASTRLGYGSMVLADFYRESDDRGRRHAAVMESRRRSFR